MNPVLGKIIYRLIQNLRKEEVFDSLHFLEQSQWWSEEELKMIQFQKIKNVIKHAYSNIPFYRQKYDEYGISPNNIEDLTDLHRIPILTKEELRKYSLNMIAKDRKYHYTQDSTSGSSGPATIVYTDRNAAAFQHAAVFRAYHWMGLDIGDKLARFWGTQLDSKRRIKDSIKDTLLNRVTFATQYLDEERMYSYYQQLKSFKPMAVYGFASAIHEFARFLSIKGLSMDGLNIKAILVTGESIFPSQRKIMEDIFKCRVYNEYGCAEFGPIAYECPRGNLHISAENNYVELEDPLAQSGRSNLIITELNNLVMPLIRYRLGDVGVISHSKCNCGRSLPVLKEVSGRTVDIIRTRDGRVVHGIYFDYIPKYFLGEIKQFQIIQEDINSVTLIVVKDHGFKQHTMENFENKLREVLGNAIEINFLIRDKIPREKTGKYRFVVSKLSL